MDNVFNTPTKDYKVLVRCFTYNQGEYIEDALNGFALQRTNFPFVCLVMDDCSTDGEQDVIKAWMVNACDMTKAEYYSLDLANLIFVPHFINNNCMFAFYLLKQNLYKYKEKKMSFVYPWRKYATYEALCEGDDYWIDSNKLQRQINFLDAHTEYTLCFHKLYTKSEKGRVHHNYFDHLETREYTTDEMLQRWTVPTGSMVMRIEMTNKFPTHPKFTYGDNGMVLTCLEFGKMFCFGDYMGVYRITPTGWTGQSIIDNCKRQISHIEGLMDVFDSCKNEIMINNLRNEYIKLYSHLFSQFKFKECHYIKKEIRITFNKPVSNVFLLLRSMGYTCKFYIKQILKKLNVI